MGSGRAGLLSFLLLWCCCRCGAAAAAVASRCPCMHRCGEADLASYVERPVAGEDGAVVQRCHRLFWAAAAFASASSTCRLDGGALAEAHAPADAKELAATVAFQQQYVWIGARRDPNGTAWRWTASGAPVAQSIWAPGQPEAASRPDRLCAFLSHDGLVYPWSCDGAMVFLCAKRVVAVAPATFAPSHHSLATADPPAFPVSGAGLGSDIYTYPVPVPSNSVENAGIACETVSQPLAAFQPLLEESGGSGFSIVAGDGEFRLLPGVLYTFCWTGPHMRAADVAGAVRAAPTNVVVYAPPLPVLREAALVVSMGEPIVVLHGSGLTGAVYVSVNCEAPFIEVRPAPAFDAVHSGPNATEWHASAAVNFTAAFSALPLSLPLPLCLSAGAPGTPALTPATATLLPPPSFVAREETLTYAQSLAPGGPPAVFSGRHLLSQAVYVAFFASGVCGRGAGALAPAARLLPLGSTPPAGVEEGDDTSGGAAVVFLPENLPRGVPVAACWGWRESGPWATTGATWTANPRPVFDSEEGATPREFVVSHARAAAASDLLITGRYLYTASRAATMLWTAFGASGCSDDALVDTTAEIVSSSPLSASIRAIAPAANSSSLPATYTLCLAASLTRPEGPGDWLDIVDTRVSVVFMGAPVFDAFPALPVQSFPPAGFVLLGEIDDEASGERVVYWEDLPAAAGAKWFAVTGGQLAPGKDVWFAVAAEEAGDGGSGAGTSGSSSSTSNSGGSTGSSGSSSITSNGGSITSNGGSSISPSNSGSSSSTSNIGSTSSTSNIGSTSSTSNIGSTSITSSSSSSSACSGGAAGVTFMKVSGSLVTAGAPPGGPDPRTAVLLDASVLRRAASLHRETSEDSDSHQQQQPLRLSLCWHSSADEPGGPSPPGYSATGVVFRVLPPSTFSIPPVNVTQPFYRTLTYHQLTAGGPDAAVAVSGSYIREDTPLAVECSASDPAGCPESVGPFEVRLACATRLSAYSCGEASFQFPHFAVWAGAGCDWTCDVHALFSVRVLAKPVFDPIGTVVISRPMYVGGFSLPLSGRNLAGTLVFVAPDTPTSCAAAPAAAASRLGGADAAPHTLTFSARDPRLSQGVEERRFFLCWAAAPGAPSEPVPGVMVQVPLPVFSPARLAPAFADFFAAEAPPGNRSLEVAAAGMHLWQPLEGRLCAHGCGACGGVFDLTGGRVTLRKAETDALPGAAASNLCYKLPSEAEHDLKPTGVAVVQPRPPSFDPLSIPTRSFGRSTATVVLTGARLDRRLRFFLSAAAACPVPTAATPLSGEASLPEPNAVTFAPNLSGVEPPGGGGPALYWCAVFVFAGGSAPLDSVVATGVQFSWIGAPAFAAADVYVTMRAVENGRAAGTGARVALSGVNLTPGITAVLCGAGGVPVVGAAAGGLGEGEVPGQAWFWVKGIDVAGSGYPAGELLQLCWKADGGVGGWRVATGVSVQFQRPPVFENVSAAKTVEISLVSALAGATVPPGAVFAGGGAVVSPPIWLSFHAAAEPCGAVPAAGGVYEYNDSGLVLLPSAALFAADPPPLFKLCWRASPDSPRSFETTVRAHLPTRPVFLPAGARTRLPMAELHGDSTVAVALPLVQGPDGQNSPADGVNWDGGAALAAFYLSRGGGCTAAELPLVVDTPGGAPVVELSWETLVGADGLGGSVVFGLCWGVVDAGRRVVFPPVAVPAEVWQVELFDAPALAGVAAAGGSNNPVLAVTGDGSREAQTFTGDDKPPPAAPAPRVSFWLSDQPSGLLPAAQLCTTALSTGGVGPGAPQRLVVLGAAPVGDAPPTWEVTVTAASSGNATGTGGFTGVACGSFAGTLVSAAAFSVPEATPPPPPCAGAAAAALRVCSTCFPGFGGTRAPALPAGYPACVQTTLGGEADVSGECVKDGSVRFAAAFSVAVAVFSPESLRAAVGCGARVLPDDVRVESVREEPSAVAAVVFSVRCSLSSEHTVTESVLAAAAGAAGAWFPWEVRSLTVAPGAGGGAPPTAPSWFDDRWTQVALIGLAAAGCCFLAAAAAAVAALRRRNKRLPAGKQAGGAPSPIAGGAVAEHESVVAVPALGDSSSSSSSSSSSVGGCRELSPATRDGKRCTPSTGDAVECGRHAAARRGSLPSLHASLDDAPCLGSEPSEQTLHCEPLPRGASSSYGLSPDPSRHGESQGEFDGFAVRYHPTMQTCPTAPTTDVFDDRRREVSSVGVLEERGEYGGMDGSWGNSGADWAAVRSRWDGGRPRAPRGLAEDDGIPAWFHAGDDAAALASYHQPIFNGPDPGSWPHPQQQHQQQQYQQQYQQQHQQYQHQQLQHPPPVPPKTGALHTPAPGPLPSGNASVASLRAAHPAAVSYSSCSHCAQPYYGGTYCAFCGARYQRAPDRRPSAPDDGMYFPTPVEPP
ncbi:hypothetical protein DIPPA_19166 [Diplonema papillatum]|nr:hypothetical protein DIPPA_19166 [Diplonema papillatum]